MTDKIRRKDREITDKKLIEEFILKISLELDSMIKLMMKFILFQSIMDMK